MLYFINQYLANSTDRGKWETLNVLLAKNVRHICDKWKTSKADLLKNCKSKKLSVFSENEIKK